MPVWRRRCSKTRNLRRKLCRHRSTCWARTRRLLARRLLDAPSAARIETLRVVDVPPAAPESAAEAAATPRLLGRLRLNFGLPLLPRCPALAPRAAARQPARLFSAEAFGIRRRAPSGWALPCDGEAPLPLVVRKAPEPTADQGRCRRPWCASSAAAPYGARSDHRRLGWRRRATRGRVDEAAGSLTRAMRRRSDAQPAALAHRRRRP